MNSEFIEITGLFMAIISPIAIVGILLMQGDKDKSATTILTIICLIVDISGGALTYYATTVLSPREDEKLTAQEKAVEKEKVIQLNRIVPKA